MKLQLQRKTVSKNIALQSIRGEYPLIITKFKAGHQWIYLSGGGVTTKQHRKFEDAAAEWNDLANKIFMEDLVRGQE